MRRSAPQKQPMPSTTASRCSRGTSGFGATAVASAGVTGAWPQAARVPASRVARARRAEVAVMVAGNDGVERGFGRRSGGVTGPGMTDVRAFS